MKTMIMLSAIPASGKTTWAKEYQRTHDHCYIVNSDEVRMEVTHGDFQDHTKQKEVWELFEKRIHEYALLDENATVIVDALNDVNEVRLKYLTTTPEFDKKVLVLFPNSYEQSSKYNGQRTEALRVPENILKGLVNKFEEPSKEVLDQVDEVITITWDKQKKDAVRLFLYYYLS